jgi:hypothetical protein
MIASSKFIMHVPGSKGCAQRAQDLYWFGQNIRLNKRNTKDLGQEYLIIYVFQYGRRIFNAGYKNISLCSTRAKYSMVWGFSRFIDRNQSFIPRCFVIPFF